MSLHKSAKDTTTMADIDEQIKDILTGNGRYGKIPEVLADQTDKIKHLIQAYAEEQATRVRIIEAEFWTGLYKDIRGKDISLAKFAEIADAHVAELNERLQDNKDKKETQANAVANSSIGI